MKSLKYHITFLAFIMVQSGFTAPADAFLFHATERVAARRIMADGFSKARMRATARLGKGVYAAEKRAVALKEVPRAEAVVRLRDSKYLKKSILDLRRPTPVALKKVVGQRDLRGAVKRGVIGPKLGREVGTAAGRSGKVVRYSSARKGGGANIFIPRKTYSMHPRIIRPEKISAVK